MKKIISIIGTRPQIIKISGISQELDKLKDFQHIILFTGQHFDDNMTTEIFKVMNINKPDYNLNINSNINEMESSSMIGHMIIEIEKILLIEKPEIILVYGDCDSTLAGAIVANKLKIKLFHIESGLRSYNKEMPEEINRICVDHISEYLLCPNDYAMENLKNEGIFKNIFLFGNLHLDLLLKYNNYVNENLLLNLKLIKNNFILMTIHRNYNTNCESLTKIFDQLKMVKDIIIFPVHPRTKKTIKKIVDNNTKINDNIKLLQPLNYLDLIYLLKNCKFLMTDSGGLQIESYYLNKKCFTIRTESEWLETFNENQNELINIDMIGENLQNYKEKKFEPKVFDYSLPNFIKILKNLY